LIIEYVNRKSEIYYLHQGQTKTGKPRYFFSKKSEGNLAEAIPDGYEIYENPQAQVYLRKIPPKLISDEEIDIIKRGLANFCLIELNQIDVKKEIVTVFIANKDWGYLEDLSNQFSPFTKQSLSEYYELHTSYEAVMRFILSDKEERLFQVQRYCYRGYIDDWIELEEGDLSNLVKKYVKHIGQDSYYELF
jgi:hypothetical protein